MASKHLGPLNTAVGAEVRRLRIAAGMSQITLASALDVAQSHLSRLEAGKLPWDVCVQLPKAAEALGTDPSTIVGAASAAIEERDAEQDR